MRSPIIGVMGPGETASPRTCEIAFLLGQQIAQQGWILLTGGRAAGVMDAASRGAKQAGGLTIGILPGTTEAGMSEAIDIPILTGMDSARNHINILTSTVIIACGMGAGTASEVALALKAQKPVILIQVNRTTAEFFRQLGGDRVIIVEQVDEAIDRIRQILS
ncbi:TIGR00725 family protein [Leptolyngbya ohadii]|uniref:TIGR00725 family protein n=1 Tax=Leptolyngbya ohadii TaxID=1962290 RepID=UPI000B5A221D|nr:TIGR00725 family protein [Leptolyngbya ohadii]